MHKQVPSPHGLMIHQKYLCSGEVFVKYEHNFLHISHCISNKELSSQDLQIKWWHFFKSVKKYQNIQRKFSNHSKFSSVHATAQYVPHSHRPTNVSYFQRRIWALRMVNAQHGSSVMDEAELSIWLVARLCFFVLVFFFFFIPFAASIYRTVTLCFRNKPARSIHFLQQPTEGTLIRDKHGVVSSLHSGYCTCALRG